MRKWRAKELQKICSGPILGVQGRAKGILRKYASKKEPATIKGNEGLYGEPCCHPNLGSRRQAKAESNPRGPIGYLLQSINLIGGIVTDDFVIDMYNEAMLPIMDAPFQCLAKFMLQRATGARTRAAAKSTMKWRELQELDQVVKDRSLGKTPKEDRGILRFFQSGGGFDAVKIKECINT